jgi:hypothetical protein
MRDRARENTAFEAATDRMQRAILGSRALLTTIIVISGGCSGNTTATQPNSKSSGREVSAAEPGRTQPDSQIEELLRRTRPNGSVRVIVQLRMPPGPDETREQRIKSAQQALLAELAPVPHTVLRTYTATPAVALEASYQALQALRDSRHVLRVEEDAVAKPFNKSGEAIKAQ